MSIKKETIKNDYDSLDYIYIEKYRGIYHREFYFSNEYKYIYDGKHLKREKNNTDHISGFFGKSERSHSFESILKLILLYFVFNSIMGFIYHFNSIYCFY